MSPIQKTFVTVLVASIALAGCSGSPGGSAGLGDLLSSAEATTRSLAEGQIAFSEGDLGFSDWEDQVADGLTKLKGIRSDVQALEVPATYSAAREELLDGLDLGIQYAERTKNCLSLENLNACSSDTVYILTNAINQLKTARNAYENDTLSFNATLVVWRDEPYTGTVRVTPGGQPQQVSLYPGQPEEVRVFGTTQRTDQPTAWTVTFEGNPGLTFTTQSNIAGAKMVLTDQGWLADCVECQTTAASANAAGFTDITPAGLLAKGSQRISVDLLQYAENCCYYGFDTSRPAWHLRVAPVGDTSIVLAGADAEAYDIPSTNEHRFYNMSFAYPPLTKEGVHWNLVLRFVPVDGDKVFTLPFAGAGQERFDLTIVDEGESFTIQADCTGCTATDWTYGGGQPSGSGEHKLDLTLKGEDGDYEYWVRCSVDDTPLTCPFDGITNDALQGGQTYTKSWVYRLEPGAQVEGNSLEMIISSWHKGGDQIKNYQDTFAVQAWSTDVDLTIEVGLEQTTATCTGCTLGPRT